MLCHLQVRAEATVRCAGLRTALLRGVHLRARQSLKLWVTTPRVLDAVGLRFDEALLLIACMVRPGLTHSCRLETRLSIGQ